MPAMDSLVTARVHPCHTRCSSYPFKSSSNRRARRGELDSRGMSSCQDLKDFVRLPFNHQHRRAPILRPPSAGPISSGCRCDECRYGRNSIFPPRALGLGPIFAPRRRVDVVGRVEDCSFSNSMARGHKLTSRTTVGGPIKSSAVTTSTTRNERQDGPSSSDPVIVVDEESPALQLPRIPLLARWKPPRYLWRSLACLIVAGQVTVRMLRGKIHVRNSIQQLEIVGPKSLGVSLLTASFVGMVFTIQFVREFARLGLTRSVGGVLALALARELAPVVTAIILAGRVGSAFAAELGTMQVSEQTDTLRVLRTDPVDYLITPRVLACCVSLPVLTLICFSVAMAASVLLADAVYNVSSNIILESAARALQPWDLISTSIKATVFGGIISIVSCSWGVTTVGGAKGVGESTTSAVVISLVCIFIADFILSWCFFQGSGDALKAAMG